MKLSLRSLIFTTMIIIVSLSIATYVFSLALGLSLFFFTPDGLALSRISLISIPINIFMVFYFPIHVTPTIGGLFIFLISVYVLCFMAAWRLREPFQNVVRESFSQPLGMVFRNYLFTMPILSSMLLIAVLVISSLQESVGVPTGSLTESNSLDLLLDLAYSPISEEVGFRISTLGLFLVIYMLWATRLAQTIPLGRGLKIAFLALFDPDEAKRMAGLKSISSHGILGGVSQGEWVILIFTSLGFGLAHLLSGSGWGLGKVTTATMTGLTLGLVYLAYGVEAPILLHWYFNYYLFVFTAASEVYGGIFIGVEQAVEMLVLSVGVAGWVGAVAAIWFKLARRGVKPPPSAQPTPAWRYCIYCGASLQEDARYCHQCGGRQPKEYQSGS